MPTDSGGALEVANFYHPTGGGYNHDKELEFEMQIGSKKFPEYPIRSAVGGFKLQGLCSTCVLLHFAFVRPHHSHAFVVGSTGR